MGARMTIYGVVDHLGFFTDTSKTLTGAKQYATRHGYDTVASRNANHYYVDVEAVRSPRGNWITPNQLKAGL